MSTTAHPERGIGQTELARLAKVSQKTVSRALGGGGGVSDKTRLRIERLATRHQYRPNTAARSTRSGTFGTVALLLGTRDGRSNLPSGLLNGVQDALAERDLNLMVVKLTDDELTNTDRVPGILREARSDGLLVDYTHGFPPRMEQLIDDFGIPAIWINTKRRINAVYPDDLSAGRSATRHLIDLGHRRIAYADFTHGPAHPAVHYSVTDRIAGYEAAMRDAGLNSDRVQVTVGEDVPRPERIRFARQLLQRSDRPTAVLCYADTTAVPICIAAAGLGLELPRELSLAIFGNEPSRTMGPIPTTTLIPQHTLGWRAVELLNQRLTTRRDLPAVAVPFDFEPGQTTMSLNV